MEAKDVCECHFCLVLHVRVQALENMVDDLKRRLDEHTFTRPEAFKATVPVRGRDTFKILKPW